MTVKTDVEYPTGSGPGPGMRKEDGRRYEFIDGTVIVSPLPGLTHQKIGYRLYGVLDAACPSRLCVVGAPFIVRGGEKVVLQPDVLVARGEDLTEEFLPAPPLLAVEILSQYTAIMDLNLTKAVYERLGVHSYWAIDPDGPRLKVFELDGKGKYEEVAEVFGDEVFEAEWPFPVRVVPRELLRRTA